MFNTVKSLFVTDPVAYCGKHEFEKYMRATASLLSLLRSSQCQIKPRV